MKNLSVILGLLTGCIITAACGYFDHSSIDATPVVSSVWVKTFLLSVYGPLVLPMLAVYLILMMESIGDITATCDVSRHQTGGALFDSRIQGGYGATLIPTWFSYAFTYTGNNRAKSGFYDAIVLVMETGFVVTAFVAIALNLLISEEDGEYEMEDVVGNDHPEVELSGGKPSFRKMQSPGRQFHWL